MSAISSSEQIASDKEPAPVSPNWDAVLAAAQTLEDYDYLAQSELDTTDVRDTEERLWLR